MRSLNGGVNDDEMIDLRMRLLDSATEHRSVGSLSCVWSRCLRMGNFVYTRHT